MGAAQLTPDVVVGVASRCAQALETASIPAYAGMTEGERRDDVGAPPLQFISPPFQGGGGYEGGRRTEPALAAEWASGVLRNNLMRARNLPPPT